MMRILIIADEVWNDSIHGNNVLTNWFEDFPAEFAEIYCSPGIPKNSVCKKYFQITDKEMVYSILKNTRAGKSFFGDFRKTQDVEGYNSTDVKNIEFMRKYFGNILRSLKTYVWNIGKINEKELKNFLDDFRPDIIFSVRFAHSKILRIEKMVYEIAKVPIVAFTGDNEYSLKRFSLSPFFWGNLMYQRKYLRNMIPKYSLYYTLSVDQKNEYKKAFSGINVKLLHKCGNYYLDDLSKKRINRPIKIIYAGKTYMNRWKTLNQIGKCLKKINIDQKKAELHIYTNEKLRKKIKDKLHDGKNLFLHRGVTTEELKEIYLNADIALCVESFNLSDKLTTRVSFSTKIIDCLASSCAVVFVGWKENAGFKYLKKEDAAICVASKKEIGKSITEIITNPMLIEIYRKKAEKCCVTKHRKKIMQERIYNDFAKIIGENKK